jgi:hypothetical protein
VAGPKSPATNPAGGGVANGDDIGGLGAQDKNRDGFLSADEISNDVLARRDSDKDGRLSAGEYAAEQLLPASEEVIQRRPPSEDLIPVSG